MKIKKINNYAILPKYQSEKASCMDLHACILMYTSDDEKYTIKPGEYTIKPREIVTIDTGLILYLDTGYEALILSRSGLAQKNGIVVLNAPGMIDEDYQGELKVVLINVSDKEFVIEHGMRIAQLKIQRKVNSQVKLEILGDEKIPETERGSGGFGSTGV